MKVLIDIGHPGHFHLFKNFAWQMLKRGHKVFFTCREKEFTVKLLEKNNFQYHSFGKQRESIFGKILGLFVFDVKMIRVFHKFRPSICLSHGSMYAAQVAWLFRTPHISFEDTFNFEQIRLYRPFTSVILTGDYPHPCLGAKSINYAGYHELAYLHPNYFSPDVNVKRELGLDEKEKYVIFRFISRKATHDRGHKGMSSGAKLEAIQEISKYARVFISSELELPPELKKYEFPLSVDRMHAAISRASLILGESATMVSEGAVLGVPGIYLDDTGRYYTKEQQEKYGLVFNFTESAQHQFESIQKAKQLLCLPHVEEEWRKRRIKLLSEKIDVTAFLVWIVENYPKSILRLKKDPDYQLTFK